jgi:hypothetical protein
MSMEQDAERVAEEAINIFKSYWQKHQHGYPGGTDKFLFDHVDKSIAEAARRLNISGGAVIWAQKKFTEKAQHFFENNSDNSSADYANDYQKRSKSKRTVWIIVAVVVVAFVLFILFIK